MIGDKDSDGNPTLGRDGEPITGIRLKSQRGRLSSEEVFVEVGHMISAAGKHLLSQ